MKSINPFKITGVTVLIALLGGLIAFAFPVNVAAAPLQQGETPPPQANPGHEQQLRKEKLEQIYQHELRFLDHISADLGRIDTITGKVDTLITKLEQHGIDPTPVQTALNEFIEQANSAAGPRDEAAAILAEHNGFNPQGKVTNVQDAAVTVRSAGVLLRNAHRTFHEALRNLRTTIRDLIGSYLPKRTAETQNQF